MRAFTLIETLATVVLLATIASVGAIGLAGASDAAKMQEAEAVLRSTDADARNLARTSGVVRLTLDDARTTLRLVSAGELVLERQSPIPMHLVDPESDTPMHAVIFEPTGRSQDYIAVLDDGGEKHTITISGLTGWTAP